MLKFELHVRFRRVFANRIESTTQVRQAQSIQLERQDGRSARWRQTNNKSEIVVPGEMFVPALFARMKQRHKRSGYRIERGSTLALVLVAAIAAERQILRCCLTIKAARGDVIHREGVTRIPSLSTTVFAAIRGAIGNQTTQVG